MSEVVVGVRKSLMASRYFGSGSLVLSDSLNPANSTLFVDVDADAFYGDWPCSIRYTFSVVSRSSFGEDLKGVTTGGACRSFARFA